MEGHVPIQLVMPLFANPVVNMYNNRNHITSHMLNYNTVYMYISVAIDDLLHNKVATCNQLHAYLWPHILY